MVVKFESLKMLFWFKKESTIVKKALNLLNTLFLRDKNLSIMRQMFFTLLFASLFVGANAQIIQKSNVFVFDLTRQNDTTYQLTKPRYITDFNANGYNNHPAFFNNNELCLAVQMPGDEQPELYLFDLEKKTKTRLTQTREGEYSPFPISGGFRFSAVRQTYGRTDTTLRVWEFPMDRLNDGRPIFKYYNNIGYYYWLSSVEMAVFLVGNPNQLAIADTRDDKLTPVATNVGRCFRKLPNGNLAFVSKSNFNSWEIKQKKIYGGGNTEPEVIAETVPGAEDFAVLPDGSFIMGKGSRLFHLDPRARKVEWREIANLRLYNINNITRIAISDDMKIAIVAD